MIRVLIADDHALMREGLKVLLERAGDIEVVGEAADGLTAVDTALRTNPDVVLMDVAMPGIGGVRATEQLLSLDSRVRVLFISAHFEERILHEALRGGAHGYLVKTADPNELATAVRTVARGERFFSPEVFSYMSEKIAADDKPGK